MLSIQALFGITAGVLELASCAVYIASILRGKTRPNRVTWWILALVSAMITASYYASGARETIWLPAVYTTCFVVIGLLSLKFGDGPIVLSFLDRVCLIGAIASALIWWFFNSAVLALYMNIIIDFIGLVPTMRKAYVRPWTESGLAWTIAVIASLLNVFAIAQWTLEISVYPLYLLIVNAAITFFIIRRKLRF